MEHQLNTSAGRNWIRSTTTTGVATTSESTGTKIERTRSPGTYIGGSRMRSTSITSSRYSSATTMGSAAVSSPDRDARDDGRLGVDGRLAGDARADHGVLVERPIGGGRATTTAV
jgi:hypothetical protein